jgi:hypothetical protein
MSHRIVFPVLAAVAFLANARSGRATPPDADRFAAVRVMVALVPPVPGSHRQLCVMMQEADAIWRPYGVTLVWLTEGTGESRAGSAALLRVHFGHGDRPTPRIGSPGPARLGGIRFFDGAVADDDIVLLTDEITETVMSTQLAGRDLHDLPLGLVEDASGRATGRVLAHELGHYLLALRTHTRNGLMRQSFAGRQLVGWDRQAFRLDAVALLRLRARTAELIAAAVDPTNGGH